MYGQHRIMSFTFEMGDSFTMPDKAIPTETGRNMEAAHYAMEQARPVPGLRRSSCGYRHAARLIEQEGRLRGLTAAQGRSIHCCCVQSPGCSTRRTLGRRHTPTSFCRRVRR